MFTRIAGVGSYLPGKPVSNNDLIQRGIDTNDEWIVSRTGIKARHLADAGCTSSDLALEASRKALASAGIDASEIDLIIVATSTPDFIFPSTACLLQSKLGNKGAMAFDVQAVCSGFVYALNIAEKFIRSGSCKKACVLDSLYHCRCEGNRVAIFSYSRYDFIVRNRHQCGQSVGTLSSIY